MKSKKKQVEKNKPNNKITILVILIVAIIVIDIYSYFYFQKFNFRGLEITDIKCEDGTINGTCSKEKPFYCYNKELLKKAFTCGCPKGYKIYFQDCKKI